jgi:hypothetical protein
LAEFDSWQDMQVFLEATEQQCRHSRGQHHAQQIVMRRSSSASTWQTLEVPWQLLTPGE